MKWSLAWILLALSPLAWAQCPETDFELSTQYCRNETIRLSPTNASFDRYEWYLCSDRLSEAVTNDVRHANNTALRDSYSFAWIPNERSLITIRSNGAIYRVTFNNTLSAVTITVGGTAAGNNRSLDLYHNGSIWQGLLSINAAANPALVSFPNGLTGAVTTTRITTGNITNTFGADLVNANDNLCYFLGANNSNTVRLLQFGNSLTNTPTITSFSVGSVTRISDIELIQTCSGWKGLVASSTSKTLHLLDFGAQLTSTPTVTELAGVSQGVSAPTGIHLLESRGAYYAFVQNENGNTLRFSFGDDLDQTFTLDNIGMVAPNGFGVGIASSGNTLKGFVINPINATRGVYTFNFGNSCTLTEPILSGNSVDLEYSSAGAYDITLVASNEFGSRATKKTVIITEDSSPSIDFSATSTQCASVPATFIPTIQGLTYAWDFNNDGVVDSHAENPTHIFTTGGTYTVRLDVDDGTCHNFSTKQITLYDEPPMPQFAINGALCSTAALTFTNLTNDAAYLGPLSYAWDFNGEFTSSQKNPTYQFGSAGTKTITLKASIPGCEHITQQVIHLTEGPEAAFSAQPICAGELMHFANQSVNANTYEWQFGDGFTSTLADPAHFYATGGNYMVTLTATDAFGCPSQFVREVAVAHQPIADFDFDIPCTGSQGITFYDRSAVTSADVVSWAWYVDGMFVSNDQNPTMSFDDEGTRTVRLEVMSSNGCNMSVEKNLTVLGAPVPVYTVAVGCQSQTSVFTDITEGVVSRLWRINGQTYTTPTVQHVFSQAGTFDVSLMVTSSDFCTSTTVGTVTVVPAPQLNFTLSSVCADEHILLTDTSIPGDPVVSRTWLLDGVPFFNGQQALLTGASAGAHELMLRVVTSSGCVFEHQKNVILHGSPVANFSMSVAYGIPPFAVTLTQQATGAVSYAWSINGVPVSTSPSFTYVINQEGNLPVVLTVTNANGCTNTYRRTLFSAYPAMNLQVRDLTIIENGNARNISVKFANEGNLPVEIFDVLIKADSKYSVSQRFNQFVGIGEEVSVGLTLSEEAIMNAKGICVFVQSAYTDISSIDNEACITLREQLIFEPPFPNPFSDEAVIRLILPDTRDVRVTFTHISGRTVLDEQLMLFSSGLHVLNYPSSHWEQGMYVVRVQVKDKVIVRKMLKF